MQLTIPLLLHCTALQGSTGVVVGLSVVGLSVVGLSVVGLSVVGLSVVIVGARLVFWSLVVAVAGKLESFNCCSSADEEGPALGCSAAGPEVVFDEVVEVVVDQSCSFFDEGSNSGELKGTAY